MSESSDKAYILAQELMKLFSYFKPKKFSGEIKIAQIIVIKSILFLNNEYGYATPSMVCEGLGMSKSNLTAILNFLEKKGLIKRKLSPEDRRKLLLSLTNDANKLLEHYHDQIKYSTSNLIDFFGEEDTKKFVELLTKANDYFYNYRKDNFDDKK